MFKLFYSICGVATAMIGYTIHGSVGWSIVNFLFWWASWVVWLVDHEVNVTIIQQTFAFFQ